MNVSDVAREAGIATSAVRFYERKGVLPARDVAPTGIASTPKRTCVDCAWS